MKRHAPIVIIGIGEMAGVFARGFLRIGRPIYPVTRETDPGSMAAELPGPALVLVAVAEKDLHEVLGGLPAPWRPRVGLLQNELLPRDWKAHHIEEPTVMAVWFEKKPGRDVRVILPTRVGGPTAGLVVEALSAIGVPSVPVMDSEAMTLELVRKNLYVLVANIVGLETGGTVGELWTQHQDLARRVTEEILDIQERLVERELPREILIEGMAEAFAADPEHQAMGRSGPERLARALSHADTLGLDVPGLRAIRERRRPEPVA